MVKGLKETKKNLQMLFYTSILRQYFGAKKLQSQMKPEKSC